MPKSRESPWVQCKTCNRVLNRGDEDENGNCCFCGDTIRETTDKVRKERLNELSDSFGSAANDAGDFAEAAASATDRLFKKIRKGKE